MRVSRNTGDTFQTEIEQRQWISSSLHEWDEKATQARIDMHRYIVLKPDGRIFNVKNYKIEKTF